MAKAIPPITEDAPLAVARSWDRGASARTVAMARGGLRHVCLVFAASRSPGSYGRSCTSRFCSGLLVLASEMCAADGVPLARARRAGGLASRAVLPALWQLRWNCALS